MKKKQLRHNITHNILNSLAICMLGLTTGNLYAGDIAQGKIKSATCSGCHGSDGIGLSQEFPNLAGQKEAYIIKQLQAFKNGERKDPSMAAMTAALNDNDMADLAAYFSNLPAKHSPQSSTMSSTNTQKAMPKATAKASKKEFPETVFISMKKSASIETFPQQSTWKGGPNMLYTAITPDAKMLLSTSPSTGSVYVFDAKSGKQLAIIKVGKAPKGVKVTPDGQFAYISNQGSADISVVEIAKLKVVATIKVEKGPHNARFTQDGKLAYVTLQGGAGIAVIDTASRKMTKVIPVPGITGPHNLDLSADEKTAFVRDFVHHVAVLDLTTGKVKKVITVGNGHGGIDVTPDGRYAATAAIGDNIVSIINTKTLTVKNINVGKGPHGIRASKDSHWLYVTLAKENTIAIINLKTMQVEKKIAVGKFPFWVAVQGNP
ncbi:c-type cytochrome [sulfur-oxidizing endosymbiont of Gigantopelta aegis]|uniref:YVTN family beta-propeller repeat protein n=1 Tax=sulfur-oxidizing endosymbiont of Gigantopelta aegis TaxID=2794934 RepID=UPI0018DE526C|nr:c-type cytochrome [sulfur-oxidizing endosymbiont of Gigantopelta aegis]